MDVKIRLILLVLLLAVLYVISKALLNITESVTSEVVSAMGKSQTVENNDTAQIELGLTQANHLAQLPLKCIQNP